MKRFISIFVIVLLLCSVPVPAFAQEVPQERDDCSIEVLFTYDGKPIDGGSLTVVRVGYVDTDGLNYYFSQEITGEHLEDLESTVAPNIQADFYYSNKDSYEFYTQTQDIVEGVAKFTDLSTGLYLVIQETATTGYHMQNPFLVAVPYMQDGVYQYNITAKFKSGLEQGRIQGQIIFKPPHIDIVPPGENLPQTGLLQWPIPVLFVAGFALLIIGSRLCVTNKRECYEK